MKYQIKVVPTDNPNAKGRWVDCTPSDNATLRAEGGKLPYLLGEFPSCPENHNIVQVRESCFAVLAEPDIPKITAKTTRNLRRLEAKAEGEARKKRRLITIPGMSITEFMGIKTMTDQFLVLKEHMPEGFHPIQIGEAE